MFKMFLFIALASGSLLAGEVGDLKEFKPNQTAKSSEVNQNFKKVKDAVNDNNSRIKVLEEENQQLKQTIQQLNQQNQQLQQIVQQLESRLQAIESNNVMAMGDYVDVIDDPNIPGGKTIRFSGVNVQIVNGTGQTHNVNGLGNLIIGYNLPRVTDGNVVPIKTCSYGKYWYSETDCTSNNGIWGTNFKTGSHNIVVGGRNAYSSYGGIVAGFMNVISREYSTTTAGVNNIASGIYSSISGGRANTTSGWGSSVSGGVYNTAGGTDSSVSGGRGNTASAFSSSISGGRGNTASGIYSSISGGLNRSVSGEYDWRAGTLFQNK